jgi:hypothetical protein
MWINEIHCEADAEWSANLELDDVKGIAKTVNDSKKGSGWLVELDTEARTVRQLSSTYTFKDSPRVFPPYRQVLPSAVGGERIIASFDARLMSRVVQAFALASGRPEVKKGVVQAVPLLFHTTEGKKNREGKVYPEPIVITGGAKANVASALAVVMPYLDESGGPGALLAKYSGRAA